MVRPVKPRLVDVVPEANYFKPRGIPLSVLSEIVLKVEELEAIRLKDLEGLKQEECAKKMGISRGTFQRIYNSAKKKIADALVNAKAMKIEGGDLKMRYGRMRGGPPAYCVCPKCGHKQEKIRGVPCIQMKCEKCGTPMIRGDLK